MLNLRKLLVWTALFCGLAAAAAGNTTIHAGAPPNLAETSIKVTIR